MNIGEVHAGTVNAVEGTQNIGSQTGGTLHISDDDKHALTDEMRKLFSQIMLLNEFLNNGAGAVVPNELYTNAMSVMEMAAKSNATVRRIKAEVTPEDKQQSSVYLAAAESVMQAAKALYKDVQPIVEQAIPAIGAIRKILGL